MTWIDYDMDIGIYPSNYDMDIGVGPSTYDMHIFVSSFHFCRGEKKII